MAHVTVISARPQLKVSEQVGFTVEQVLAGGTHLSFFSLSLQLRVLWRRPPQPAAQRDRSLIYQYKIQDKSVSFFAKGLSPAVL